MDKIKDFVKKYKFHALSIIISIAFIVCSILFFKNSFLRVIDSFIDLFNSVKYYIQELFEINLNAFVSVLDFGSVRFEPFVKIPNNFDSFKELWVTYWQVFIQVSTFQGYMNKIASFIYNFSKIFMVLVVPFVVIIVLYIDKYIRDENNDYNRDSLPLKIFKIIEKKVIQPVYNFFCYFCEFLKKNKKYIYIWLLIWCYNFNILTIVIEFLSYYFYFVVSFNILSLYTQVYKLFCDLSVIVAFFPLPIWLIFALLIVRYVCYKTAYEWLYHFENRNCGFINSLPFVVLVSGTMGSKKTTLLTDMSLSLEKIHRTKASNLIFECDMKFPNFPWINLEKFMQAVISEHQVYSLATCKKMIKHIKKVYLYTESRKSDCWSKEKLLNLLLEKYHYSFKNFIFDYDTELYDLYYDNGMYLEYIWDVILDYAQLYFIYTLKTSLIISNYAVRNDFIMKDKGNYPLMNFDFFKRNSVFVDEFSKYSHILDFDSMRLGRKVLENNPNRNCFDIGIRSISEYGKDRPNNLELQEVKKNSYLANPKNDRFNRSLKLIRHSSSVMHYEFVKLMADEQRVGSLCADDRELFVLLDIIECSDISLTLPLFSFYELFYDFVLSKFLKFYRKYRYIRADNTLFMYLFKNIIEKIYNHYKRIYNTFGYYRLEIESERGIQKGKKERNKYYLIIHKVYNKRFSSDCYGEFFDEKNLRSDIGINDLDCYCSEKASIDELKKQNSYFVADLFEDLLTDS